MRTRIAADVRTIARLGGPLLVNNLSLSGMSFADTVMAGQIGAADLAGLAIGVAYFHLHMFVALGLLIAVSPAVAHAYGADDAPALTRYVRQSLWLALVFAVILVVGLRQVDWVLPALGIAPEILPVAIGYDHAMSWGMPAFTLFFALRFASEGMGNTKPIMYIAFMGLLLNVLGNWIFMYGKLGMPALGAVGCGVATSLTQWIMFFALLFYTRHHAAYRHFAFFAHIERPHGAVLGELLRLGLPIAGGILAEGGLFVAAALIMGVLGAITAGAHQIALNFAAFMFMVPLSISSATTIHVGHTIGRGDIAGARLAGLTGIGMCLCVMVLSACGILIWNEQIAALYTKDAVVRDLAATLLLMAAIFQVSDGVQVGAAGALRGFKDTAVPMVMCVFSYWVVGFPLAYFLGIERMLGPRYVWVGLIAGLTVCSVLLMARYLVRTRQSVRAMQLAEA